VPLLAFTHVGHENGCKQRAHGLQLTLWNAWKNMPHWVLLCIWCNFGGCHSWQRKCDGHVQQTQGTVFLCSNTGKWKCSVSLLFPRSTHQLNSCIIFWRSTVQQTVLNCRNCNEIQLKWKLPPLGFLGFFYVWYSMSACVLFFSFIIFLLWVNADICRQYD